MGRRGTRGLAASQTHDLLYWKPKPLKHFHKMQSTELWSSNFYERERAAFFIWLAALMELHVFHLKITFNVYIITL